MGLERQRAGAGEREREECLSRSTQRTRLVDDLEEDELVGKSQLGPYWRGVEIAQIEDPIEEFPEQRLGQDVDDELREEHNQNPLARIQLALEKQVEPVDFEPSYEGVLGELPVSQRLLAKLLGHPCDL